MLDSQCLLAASTVSKLQFVNHKSRYGIVPYLKNDMFVCHLGIVAFYLKFTQQLCTDPGNFWLVLNGWSQWKSNSLTSCVSQLHLEKSLCV